jgi:hypothetical protein
MLLSAVVDGVGIDYAEMLMSMTVSLPAVARSSTTTIMVVWVGKGGTTRVGGVGPTLVMVVDSMLHRSLLTSR